MADERTDQDARVAIMTEEELTEHTQKVIRSTLTALGIDISQPIEVQRDFQALRDWRVSVESVKSKALVTSIGIIVVGLAAAFWLGFKTMCGR